MIQTASRKSRGQGDQRDPESGDGGERVLFGSQENNMVIFHSYVSLPEGTPYWWVPAQLSDGICISSSARDDQRITSLSSPLASRSGTPRANTVAASHLKKNNGRATWNRSTSAWRSAQSRKSYWKILKVYQFAGSSYPMKLDIQTAQCSVEIAGRWSGIIHWIISLW
jgi:hypothetical protein